MTAAERAEYDRLSHLARKERRLASRKRRRRDLIPALEMAQVRALIDAARADGPYSHALVAVGFHFGLRAGEYGRLRRDRLRLDAQAHAPAGELYIDAEKDSVSRTQPILPEILDLRPILRDHLRALAAAPETAASPWLFPAPREPARGISRQHVYDVILRVGTAAGIPKRALYPHVLKATIGSHLHGAGASGKYVQEWLRHKQRSSTERYEHLTGDQVRQARERIAGIGAALR